MKKVLCVFFAILTLSFCFVLNVSAEGVELADYDYKNYDLYKFDANFLKESRQYNISDYQNFLNFFGFELLKGEYYWGTTAAYNYIYYPNISDQNMSNIFNRDSLIYPSAYVKQIQIFPISETLGQIKLFIRDKEYNYSININVTHDGSNVTRVDVQNYSSISNHDLSNVYIFLPHNLSYSGGSGQILVGQFQFHDSEYDFIKPKTFIKNFKSVFKGATYIEPEEMAMRANVTYSLPYVINYVEIVVNSIFTPTGALYSLAPVAIISISISVLLLGAYIIKRFSWGI